MTTLRQFRARRLLPTLFVLALLASSLVGGAAAGTNGPDARDAEGGRPAAPLTAGKIRCC